MHLRFKFPVTTYLHNKIRQLEKNGQDPDLAEFGWLTSSRDLVLTQKFLS